jgi:hypothetical protein
MTTGLRRSACRLVHRRFRPAAHRHAHAAPATTIVTGRVSQAATLPQRFALMKSSNAATANDIVSS